MGVGGSSFGNYNSISKIKGVKLYQNNKVCKENNYNKDLNKKGETTVQYKINKYSNNFQLFDKEFEKMSKIPPIGIHIGTSNCCIGIWINGKFQIIQNDLGENITPSYITFEENQILIGKEAKNKITKSSINTLYCILRLIGRKFDDQEIQNDMKTWPFDIIKDPESNRPKIIINYKLQKKDFYAEEILAIFFSYLKQNASDFMGKEVKDAVISVPNYFNQSQRQCIKDSAKIANINCLRLITDSSSIGIACYHNENCHEKNCLIFDLGGGFLNTCILTVEDGLIEERALSGNIHLGGEDFDKRLIEYCIDKFERKYGIKINRNSNILGRLKKFCENAKIDLSFLNSTKIFIENLIDGKNLDIIITRSIFEEICMDLFQKCLLLLDRVLKDSRLGKNNINEIIMVGGSSNIPKIQQLIKEYFNGKELIIKRNKSELVAEGASIEGAHITIKDEKIDKYILLRVIPFSLGVETVGGVMTVLIPRNSTLPVKKSLLASNYGDNQSNFLISIFEGERQLTKDNNLIGEFILDITEPMPRELKQIEIVFDATYINDINDIFVTAKEISTGKTKQC